jgi:putative N6-adenine-specific DNA methylase
LTEVQGLMRELREAASAAKNTEPLPPILCRDADPQAVEAARENAAAAGIADDLTFETGDVATLDLGAMVPGTVVANPPYGERLQPDDLRRTYHDLAQTVRRAKGWALVVLSGSPLWSDATLARPRVDHKLWNGPLHVRLLRYEA